MPLGSCLARHLCAAAFAEVAKLKEKLVEVGMVPSTPESWSSLQQHATGNCCHQLMPWEAFRISAGSLSKQSCYQLHSANHAVKEHAAVKVLQPSNMNWLSTAKLALFTSLAQSRSLQQMVFACSSWFELPIMSKTTGIKSD